MGDIPLTLGRAALVDDDDVEWLHQWKWTAARTKHGRFVAFRQQLIAPRTMRPLTMARQMLGLRYGDPRQADHVNHDGLDNRRSNLRIVSAAANKQNQPSRGGSSRFVGVTWDRRGCWRAQIQVNGVMRNLGRFDSQEDAARARDAFVLSHGTHHALNFSERVVVPAPAVREDRVPYEPPRSPIEERFWAKVDRCGSDECWPWIGRGRPDQHAKIRLAGKGSKSEGVHRVSWILAFGPIPDNLWVLHRCDNPRCVNPAHLFLGTVLDNNADRHRKGRYARNAGCGY